ncbi:MerR family transcriptional regulator [Shouchella shacheensis]|uniref:MerR family transcriptional regulator n=1 Tax=Shouchella shacheensis TaxID=1649580 RepID=UPI00073FFD20|nr:MerR family transcriptional regulator [Shouchella shacheensis]
MEVTIGQFAKFVDTTIRTLRYYDKMGLLSPRKFNKSGQKLYTRLEWERYQQITIYKLLGLSLKEIKEQMTNQPFTNRELLLVQKQLIEKKQEELNETLEVIKRMERLYKAEGVSEDELDEFAFIMLDVFRREKRQIQVFEDYFESDSHLKKQLQLIHDPDFQERMDRDLWYLLQAIRKAVRSNDAAERDDIQDILKEMHSLFPINQQFFYIVENQDFLTKHNKDFNNYFPENIANYLYKEMKSYYDDKY